MSYFLPWTLDWAFLVCLVPSHCCIVGTHAAPVCLACIGVGGKSGNAAAPLVPPTIRGSLGLRNLSEQRFLEFMVRCVMAHKQASTHLALCQSVKPTSKGAFYPGKSTSLPCSPKIMGCWKGFGYQVPIDPDHRPKKPGAGTSPTSSLKSWPWHTGDAARICADGLF